MKNLILLLTISLTSLQSFAQWTEFVWDTITFEEPYEYLVIDTSSQDIWQIGEPNKIFFDSAYSITNAIVTDTTNSYPINNYSFFDLFIGDYNVDWFPYDNFIEIKHKFDTDTLKDGAYITVSYDNGQTWMNIINDTANWFDETPNEFNMFVDNLYSTSDTLFNGEYGFSGNSGNWVTTRFSWYSWPVYTELGDTLIIRFNYISDSIETYHEGWMIDNIRLYSVDLGGFVDEIKTLDFKILPNPLNESAMIEMNRYNKVEFSVYNILGQLLRQKNYFNNQPIIMNKENFNSGIYFVKIKTDEGLSGIRKLIIR